MRLGRILAGLIAVVLGMAPLLAEASPAAFSWGSYSPTGLTTYGVYDADDVTILETGDLAQLIWVGPNGVIDLPLCGGAPGGDDKLLDTHTVQNTGALPPPPQNKGYLTQKTYTFGTTEPQSGGAVFVRAWNAPSPSSAASHGDSVTATLTPMSTVVFPRWNTVNSACDPTAVQWGAISAQMAGSAIHVAWETTSEVGLSGFNVWRSTSADGQYTVLNTALISPAGGPAQGAAYSFDDTDVVGGTTYYYKVEAVGAYSYTIFIGPVSAIASVTLKTYLPLVMR